MVSDRLNRVMGTKRRSRLVQLFSKRGEHMMINARRVINCVVLAMWTSIPVIAGTAVYADTASPVKLEVISEDEGVAAVRPWDRPRQSLMIRNVGSEAVDIDKVAASCGCVSPKIEPTVIQPGETAELSFTLDPSDANQVTSVRFVLYPANGSPFPLDRQFKYRVRRDVLVSPMIDDVGGQVAGRPVSSVFTVSFSEEIEVSAVSLAAPREVNLQGAIGEPEMTYDREGNVVRTTVKVAIDGTAPRSLGEFSYHAGLMWKNGDDIVRVPLKVQGYAVSPVASEPEQIFFGYVTQSQPARKSVTLKYREDDVAITGVSMIGKEMESRAHIVSKNNDTIVVELTPREGQAGAFDEVLEMRVSSDKGDDVVAIPFVYVAGQ